MKSFLNVFLTIFVPVTLVLMVTFHFSNRLAMDSAKNEQLMEMQSKWNILSSKRLNTSFDNETKRILSELSKNTSLRITFISNSGDILYDSLMEEGEEFEINNPMNFPEIKKAFEGGFGYDTRVHGKSDMMYLAGRYDDGSILRLAHNSGFIANLKNDAMVQNFRLFLFTFFTIGIISFILARKITLPVRKFNAIADNIEAGVKDISFPNFTDKTMSRVADIFYRIYNTMNNKQNELENERYKLQHIFSILDEGIILLDNDYRLKYFNSKAIEHLGVGLTTGKNIVDSVNNMDVINFIIEILNSKTDSIIQLDLRMKKFEAHLRYLDDEMLIVLYNITERTQYEAFKTELIGNITHELKTPLAMIMGYAETLLNNTSVDKQNLEKFLGIIHNNSKRLNNIINDILELHRLEHSPEGFTVDEPLQLDTLFGELMDRYEGFESKTVMQSNCKEILMLREHVMTLVTNLVDNAHKYSHSNVVEVSIRKRDTEMIIEVADEGPVIPEEEKKRIFERFYTVNKSKNRNQTGTGLGLSIVKHIASLYDGSVTLHQNHKGGNTFTITAFERPVRSLPADEDGDGENFRL